MSELTGEFSRPYITETLLLDPAVQLSLRGTFQAIDEVYSELGQKGKTVKSLAALAVMDSGEIIEVAKVTPQGQTSKNVEPKNFLVHCIDLRSPDEALSQRTVKKVLATRNDDLVLALETKGAEADKPDMLSLPGPVASTSIEGAAPRYADRPTEYFRTLRERLGIEL